ncbi:LrgB family protein [Lampropedia puyangensis]|uniref:LrgB family protein n=1 Tax=Lampropedia puyangensis TaxID=1330072 RepID=A0A4S8F137_9BURK|nr:LrgB family protein [Lampropedia puyangensis]THU00993.1 LrgB family protein [Lampropedia puyangensis]
MNDFVELWLYLSTTPLFGLTATLVVYLAIYAVYIRLGAAPWANPVLWSVVVLATVLIASHVPYQTYFAGAQFIHFLLGPAVVALAYPMWQRRNELRKRGIALVTAAVVGGSAASLSAVGLAWLFGLPGDVIVSMAPKSVTAPVAMGIADAMGGVPALAAVFAVLTGMVGAISGKYVFDGLGISTQTSGMVVRGFALGTASHGIGAARALQVNPDAGAYAGLALGIQVLVASTLMPLLFRWFAG